MFTKVICFTVVLFSSCNTDIPKQLKETPGSLCTDPLSKAVSGNKIWHKNFPMSRCPFKWFHHWMHARLLVKLVCRTLRVHWKPVNYVRQPGSGWAFVQKGYLVWFLLSEHNRLENNLWKVRVIECFNLKFTVVQLFLLCMNRKSYKCVKSLDQSCQEYVTLLFL